MAYEIELAYPIQDEQLHDKDSLLQVVRERLSIIDVLNREDCDYPQEVSALTSDIRILMRAALDKEDAEKVIQCGREGLEEAIHFAETIAVSVEVDDLHPLKIKKGTIFSLMYGLREMLERIKAKGEQQDGLDPLSPAEDEEGEPVDVSLMVLPNPASELDPAEASRWLRETMPHYIEMLGEASQEVDAVDCDDSFYALGNDLKRLVEGCHEAIERNVSVRLSPEMKGGEPDSMESIGMLATLVAGVASIQEPAEHSRELLGSLARTLSRRIKGERASIEKCRYGTKTGEAR